MTTKSYFTDSAQISSEDLPGLHGTVITRSDPDYDQGPGRLQRGSGPAPARRRPVCADATDVIACVELARDRVLPLGIRGGGHHGGGFGVWDDALVIDLGGIRGVSVDPVAGTSASAPAVPGVRSTAQRELSEWRRRPDSCPRPGWPG